MNKQTQWALTALHPYINDDVLVLSKYLARLDMIARGMTHLEANRPDVKGILDAVPDYHSDSRLHVENAIAAAEEEAGFATIEMGEVA